MTSRDLVTLRDCWRLHATASHEPEACRMVTLPTDIGFSILTVEECNRRLSLRRMQMGEAFISTVKDDETRWHYLPWQEAPVRVSLLRVPKGLTVSETLADARREAAARGYSELLISQSMHTILTLPRRYFEEKTLIICAHRGIPTAVKSAPGRRGQSVRRVQLCIQTKTVSEKNVTYAQSLHGQQSVCSGGPVYVAFRAPPMPRIL